MHVGSVVVPGTKPRAFEEVGADAKLHEVLFKSWEVKEKMEMFVITREQRKQALPLFCSSTNNLGRNRVIAVEMVHVPEQDDLRQNFGTFGRRRRHLRVIIER